MYERSAAAACDCFAREEPLLDSHFATSCCGVPSSDVWWGVGTGRRRDERQQDCGAERSPELDAFWHCSGAAPSLQAATGSRHRRAGAIASRKGLARPVRPPCCVATALGQQRRQQQRRDRARGLATAIARALDPVAWRSASFNATDATKSAADRSTCGAGRCAGCCADRATEDASAKLFAGQPALNQRKLAVGAS